MDPTLNNKSWLTSSSKKGNWKTKENSIIAESEKSVWGSVWGIIGCSRRLEKQLYGLSDYRTD